MIRKTVISLALISVLLYAAFCPPLSAKDKMPIITVGASPLMSSAGIYIAKEKGYFKDEGLDVDLTMFGSAGAQMTVLLSNGSLDVGGGGVTAGLLRAINQGAGIKLVADKGSMQKGTSQLALLVRSDHIASGRYKSYRDLKGFTIGLIMLEGSNMSMIIKKFLDRGNVPLADVKFIKIPFPAMNIGFMNKGIDAAVQSEPYVAKAVMDQIAVRVAGVDEVFPGIQGGIIFYSVKFIKEKKDLAEKFMVAYLKGLRDYNDAFKKGIKKNEILDILKKYIKLEPEDLWNRVVLASLNPDGYINIQSVQEQIQWFEDNKLIEKAPSIEQLIDHSFIEKAIKKLGKYKNNE
ncbi:MAG: ABC transporter substrate-binding protein [Candidatus Omnitrophota bacterium]|nr:ABC transporter substrate-binding protein [Candidatus Omnitrophota bacterium]